MSSYGQSPYASQMGNRPSAFGAGASSSSSHNNNGAFGSASGADSPLAKLREYTSKVEDLIDTYTHPIKPYLPALGRFLIVVTFLEDALRIMTQWSDQKYYLQRHRHFPWGISHIFLFSNVVVGSNLPDFLPRSIF
jgi:ER-derived vesicles protein